MAWIANLRGRRRVVLSDFVARQLIPYAVGFKGAFETRPLLSLSAVSFAQLAAEQPIDGYRVERDHRQYEYPGTPEQKGQRLLRRGGAADRDRIGHHVGPEHDGERKEGGQEEHHGQSERPAVAPPPHTRENAVYCQQ